MKIQFGARSKLECALRRDHTHAFRERSSGGARDDATRPIGAPTALDR